MDTGLAVGVLVGLYVLRLIGCVGVDGFPGDANFPTAMPLALVVLRIVDGVRMVFLRIDGGLGRFGERIDKGGGRSISVVDNVS